MSNEIHSYIPQRPPFVMVDEVLHADETLVRTKFTISSDNLFVANGNFTEPGLVENMAQTAAAGTGYKAKQDGKEAPVGYIAALKNLKIDSLPRINDTITTEITFQHTVMNAHIVQGRVMVADKEIANCELKIFIKS